jgi:anti-sigma B factor antagonist
MPLDVARHDGALGPLVVVSGALDITTADALERSLMACEEAGPDAIELDLRGVDFFDSTGLQIVLDAHVRATSAGRRLVVVAGDGEARRVLDLAEVTADLEVR